MNENEFATFAGGCFWCMQSPFDALDGVIETVVGYTGGETEVPAYEEVCTGLTGHAEVVRVTFDPGRVTYQELLDVFLKNIDPTDADGQFADQGSQYRPSIFVHSEEQRSVAEAALEVQERSGRFDEPVEVAIEEAEEFYQAEEYHQKYYQKCATHYRIYRHGSGREEYLKETWGENV